ncbi:hypothetical protein ACFOQM_06340 [Paenibacillus sp. GCM10012307]|uniref:Uncharacterized protein n=1 Tax=Paenibacillus roseus TaxID=2798579 RepID=A0A934J3P1_9BACL|nr:hypothetical protein [Paenibacillus roseus]MBJ6360918.1 hypothetical protein [Paenibacillus roseus]
MDIKHRQLLSILNTAFNPEGDIHFLAIAKKEIQVHGKERPVHQVRVALTFQEGDTVNPYYDGTDLFVIMDEDSIQFTLEEEWADGPPAVEGSPIELALGWVSKLAEPFYFSPEALAASQTITSGNAMKIRCQKEDSEN